MLKGRKNSVSEKSNITNTAMFLSPEIERLAMLKKLSPSLLLILSLLVNGASHAEVFRLQFDDTIFGGHHTIDLQQALYKQFQVDSSRLGIDRIDVVVKSQYGGGLVWPGSRYSQVGRRTVTGYPANFNNPSDWTFSHLIFPVRGSADDLQLNLNGQFKLREVIVHTPDFRDAENAGNNTQGNVRMILPMFHLQLMGLNEIDLKQLVRSDTRMNPDEFHLKGIEVSVKSRQQGGQVWLVSGHRVSELQDVSAAGRFFASNDPGSYGRNYFKVGQGNNQSMPWLLKLNGDIKLNEIVINLVRR